MSSHQSSPSNSRPSTAASRPSTAGGRPSTAGGNGRRHLGSSSIDSGSSSGIHSTRNNISQEIIDREFDGDNLLRIMNYNNIQLENEAMMLIESIDNSNSLKSVQRLKELISQGLNTAICRGYHGYTLLHHAANKGSTAIIAELLKQQRGISVNVGNNEKETPLHLAVYNGHILTVDQLLDFGADINAVNANHETCLFYAVRKSFPVIVRLLLQRGIDMNIKDQDGDKAIDHAINNHPLVLKAFDSMKSKNSDRLIISEGKEGNNNNKLSKALTYDDLLLTFSFLEINDILRCACVSSKWHRVSEHTSLWKSLGIRKWELALQNSLGFTRTPSSSFLKPPRKLSSSSSNSSSAKLKKSNSVER
jgi:ankyrin repeat protein